MKITTDLGGDCRIASLVKWAVDRSQWVYASKYPDLTYELTDLPAWWWRALWQYFYLGELPPQERVYCGIAVPEITTNLGNARAAAQLAGLDYVGTETAMELAQAVEDLLGPSAGWPTDDTTG